MLLKNVIAYLEDKSIKANDRFKVVTGFDTQADCKDHDDKYWFNALYQSNIMTTIETAEATSSVSSFFSSMTAVVTGNTLEKQLKAAYKKGSTSSDKQADGQEEYIGIIVAYLKKNQANESLIKFKFEEPATLLSKAVEYAAGATCH